MTVPVLDNTSARRLFMARHLLAETPSGGWRGDDLPSLIHDLGFVQLDSIRTVERAHHMIIRARRPTYRTQSLKTRMERGDRSIFEHWTHDASVIPMAFLPYWKFKFERARSQLLERFKSWQGHQFEEKLEDTLRHIAREGPVGSRDIGSTETRSSGGWWDWHPSKTALEFLWRTGSLAVTRRENFNKIYDLAERVYPECRTADLDETVHWACNAALDRLGFATSGELAAFWNLVSPEEAKAWAAGELDAGRIERVDVAGADGRLRQHLARVGVMDTVPDRLAQPARIRVLSPFDPMLRDRKRAERLFGFSYRIEIFVPEPQRTYGYYIFPVLQGERIIGRLDAKADRATGTLTVRAFWPERGVRMGTGRTEKLCTEIGRLARFAECPNVNYKPDWLRGPA